MIEKKCNTNTINRTEKIEIFSSNNPTIQKVFEIQIQTKKSKMARYYLLQTSPNHPPVVTLIQGPGGPPPQGSSQGGCPQPRPSC